MYLSHGSYSVHVSDNLECWLGLPALQLPSYNCLCMFGLQTQSDVASQPGPARLG